MLLLLEIVDDSGRECDDDGNDVPLRKEVVRRGDEENCRQDRHQGHEDRDQVIAL